MDFNKVKKAIKDRHYEMKSFIPDVCGMGADGFRAALENETLKVVTLEKITKALSLPMGYWWDENITMASEKHDPSAIGSNKFIEYLIDDNTRLKEQVDELKERLIRYESKKKGAI